MHQRLLALAAKAWLTHRHLLSSYQLYRASALLLAQVIATGRLELNRLIGFLMGALLGYLSRPWDEDPDPWTTH